MPDEVLPYILNDITQIVTAIGVILTAISSIMNRRALNKVDKKVDTAVSVASETRTEAKKAHQDTIDKVVAVKTAALAVNAEVVEKIHEVGVEAGKLIATNGKNGTPPAGSNSH